jgi:putative SOS response-associated peptidase YedK
MALIRRGRHMDWLDMSVPDEALLRPLPEGSFVAEELEDPALRAALL